VAVIQLKHKHCSGVFSHFIFPEPQFSCLLFFKSSTAYLEQAKDVSFLATDLKSATK